MGVLGEFEGNEVIGTRVAIRRAGDGLSQALSIEPVALHKGEKVYVVLECEVGPIKFSPSKDDPNALIRGHDLIAGTATLVDAVLVKEVLDAQRDKIDEALGRQRLDFTELVDARVEGDPDV